MLCCSCCSYKETFSNFITSVKVTNILDEIKESKIDLTKFVQNDTSLKQKILDKLDYVTGYKKLLNFNQDVRIKQIENITESNDIIEELNTLGLAILYKNKIKDLENDIIDDLDKYTNILKTKYLIDNEVITSSIDDRAYKEVEFKPPNQEPKHPKNTNKTYYDTKIIPLINEQLGSKTTNILIELKKSEIESIRSMHPDIYIKDKDGEIVKNIDNQIYLNDEFKRKFKQNVDEYNIEVTNTDLLKVKVRNDFENGNYLGDGSYNIKRADYETEFSINNDS